MKIFPFSLLGLSLCVVSCKTHQHGMNPSALQEYVAMTDAQATVQAMDAKKKTAALSPSLQVRPLEEQNNIYLNDGSLAFAGLPATEEQTVQVYPDGGIITSTSFDDNPYGTYIGFTPQAIYHFNRSTGTTTKVPRDAAAKAANKKAANSLSTLGTVMDNTLGKGI